MPAAATRILADQLTGVPGVVAASVLTVSDGYLSGATRLVQGYFDGSASFHVAVEDLATHKMVASQELHASLLAAMDQASHLIAPGAHPFSTMKEDLTEAWGQGRYEEVVAKDPAFSAAWLAWVQQRMAQGDNRAGLEIANRALQAPLRSPMDRAQIELLAAVIKNDQPAKLTALDAMSKLAPLDVQTWRTLADAQMNARNFAQAAAAFRQITQLEPANPEARNLLGYALGFGGDLDGAKQVFAEYGKMAGQAPNSFDSLGEVYFANGKFADAQQAFEAAQKLNPGFLGESELLKLAYAKWLGGDLEAADQIMKEFLISRVKQHDPLTSWREAVWLYSTGREPLARASLEKSLADPESTREARDLAEKQLALWKNPELLPHDAATLKNLYARTPPAQDGLVRVLYAKELLRAGQTDEARKLVRLWPLPESAGDPIYQAFLYPATMELRKALQ